MYIRTQCVRQAKHSPFEHDKQKEMHTTWPKILSFIFWQSTKDFYIIHGGEKMGIWKQG